MGAAFWAVVSLFQKPTPTILTRPRSSVFEPTPILPQASKKAERADDWLSRWYLAEIHAGRWNTTAIVRWTSSRGATIALMSPLACTSARTILAPTRNTCFSVGPIRGVVAVI